MRLLSGAFCAVLSISALFAQSMGSAGSITGPVTDPSGATVAGATVSVRNKVTGFDKSAHTDSTGVFNFNGLAPKNYHLAVMATGFRMHKSPSQPT